MCLYGCNLQWNLLNVITLEGRLNDNSNKKQMNLNIHYKNWDLYVNPAQSMNDNIIRDHIKQAQGMAQA
jgi:hypothetical protein